MGSGVGVTVGVKVAAGVEVMLGVTVQPGGMVGRLGRMEQPVIAITSQIPRIRRGNFIPFLYWQNTGESSGVRSRLSMIY
jgi:hypothetical protein